MAEDNASRCAGLDEAGEQPVSSGAGLRGQLPPGHSSVTPSGSAEPRSVVHWRKVLRNIFSTWMGYLVTVVVGFLLSPFVVHHLGNTGYGVWTLIVSLTGYFGMLDLGLRQSVGRFVARYVALKDEENVNRTISTAVAMLAGGGLLALAAVAAMNVSFGVFKVDHQLEAAARTALVIVGINISIALPMSVFNAVLFSLERFDILNGVSIVSALTRASLVVAFLNSGYGVVALAVITMIGGLAEYSAMAVCAKRLYRPLKISWQAVHFGRCKELFGFGIYRFIWIIANQLIFYTDSVVIGVFLNAAAITYYAIAGSLINYGRNIVALTSDTLYPAAARLDAKKDMAGLRELEILGTTMALLVGLPICLGFLFLGKQFIALWMGKAYVSSAAILIILTIPQITSMSQYTSAIILVGMAKHKMLAYIALGEGLANLILSVLLVRKIGIIGVAWGTVIPHAISTAVVVPLYTLSILKMRWSTYLTRAFIRPFICAAPVAGVCYSFSKFIESPSWLLFGGEAFTVCGLFAVLSCFICLTRTQRAILMGKLRVFLRLTPAVQAS